MGWRFTVFPSFPAAETIMKSDVVRKIGFTGSTAVGKILMKQAADTVKKVRRQAELLPVQGMHSAIHMHECASPAIVARRFTSRYPTAGTQSAL